MKFFENFIPHETTNCNDKDPSWINKQIKALTQEKNALNSKLYDKLDAFQIKLKSFKPIKYSLVTLASMDNSK